MTVGILFIYQFSVRQGHVEEMTCSIVFTTVIFANIFLTLVNRSFYFSVFATLKYKNTLMIVVLSAMLVLLAIIVYIPAFPSFFKVASLDLTQISWAVVIAFISVILFEFFKLVKRKSNS